MRPIYYTVTICQIKRKTADVLSTFNKLGQPVGTPGKGPKLYMVTHDKEIVYVGMATRTLRARLRTGFQADGKHGYHGYRWAKQDGRYAIHCWMFDGTTSTMDLETIEAEAVYVLRKSYDHWPKHQTEIHFHESTRQHRALAAQLVRVLRIDLSDRTTLGTAWKNT